MLAALAAVPRERFVPATQRDSAYENAALPIGAEQTISQPLVVARMLELLGPTPEDRVLDIGTGSGYHAALLAQLCAHVWTVERHPSLSRTAAAALTSLGVANVTAMVGDGSAGLPDEAPFDRINIAAACPAVPDALVDQLAPEGRLVAPVGVDEQRLLLIRRHRGAVIAEWHDPVRFVPLICDR